MRRTGLMRRAAFALGLLLPAAVLAAGCQSGAATDRGGGDGGGHAASPQKTRGGTAPAATGSAQATGTASSRPAVTKTTTFPLSGTSATTTLGFAGLQVNGQLATLTLVWTPHGVGEETVSLSAMSGGTFNGHVALLDPVHLKRYTVVKDSDSHDLGPDNSATRTRNNQPVTTNYTFAAPQDNAASVDVYLDDRKVFPSVPVTR